MRNVVAHSQQDLKGELRICAPPEFGSMVIAPLLAEFREQWPKLTVRLELASHFQSPIVDGFDLAIRGGDLDDSRLIKLNLSTRRVYVCATPAYLEKNGAPSTTNDLTAHPCAVLTTPTRSHPEYCRFLENNELVKHAINAVFFTNNGTALLNFVLSNAGLAMLPDYLADSHIENGTLVQLLEDCSLPPYPINIVYSRNQIGSPKVRRFIAFLKQHF